MKFGPKGTEPQQEGCTFHVSHAARCAVSDSRPSCCHKSLQKIVIAGYHLQFHWYRLVTQWQLTP